MDWGGVGTGSILCDSSQGYFTHKTSCLTFLPPPISVCESSHIVGLLVVFAMSEQIIRLRVVVCFLTPVQVRDPFIGTNNCYTSELAKRPEAMRILC